MGFSGRTYYYAIAVAVLVAVASEEAITQAVAPTNSGPNPYSTVENFAKMPEGRDWGSTAAVDIDPDGSSIWVAERCSAQAQGFISGTQMREGQPFNCDGVDLDPILKFDA